MNIVDVDGAEYFDQMIDWCKLSSGQELIVGEKQIYDVSQPSAPVLAATLPYGSGLWATVRGHDLVAIPERSKESTSVVFRALPSGGIVGSVTLPIPSATSSRASTSASPPSSGTHMASAEGADGVLVVIAAWLFFLRIESVAPFSCSVLHAAYLGDTGTALGKELAYPEEKKGSASGWSASSEQKEIVQSAALWVDGSGALHALLGSKGRVLVVPLTVTGAASGTGAGAGGVPDASSAQPLTVQRIIHMHEPMRKSDSDAVVRRIAVWYHAAGDGVRAEGGAKKAAGKAAGSAEVQAASVVTVGSDGNIAVAVLHDGTSARTDTGCDRSWHATSNGSGGSKGYPYAPCTLLGLHQSGVAFTGTWVEPYGHFWDLTSPKTSPAGKLLCKTGKLANHCRPGLGHSDVMTATMLPSGVVACTNSNDMDDPTLKLVVPAGK